MLPPFVGVAVKVTEDPAQKAPVWDETILTDGATGAQKIKPFKFAVPSCVTTLILPLAPPPTTAVMVVAFTTLTEVAAIPPKLTAVTPERFVPEIVIVVPDAAVVGVKDVIVCAFVVKAISMLSRQINVFFTLMNWVFNMILILYE